MWVTKLRHVNIFTRTHVDFSEVPIELFALFMQTERMNWDVRNFTDFNHGMVMVMTSLSVIMTLFVAGVNYRFCVCLYDGGRTRCQGLMEDRGCQHQLLLALAGDLIKL